MKDTNDNREPKTPVGSTDLVADLARFMSYAYQRGRLDGNGMKDGADKELIVKKVGELEAHRWECAARHLLAATVKVSQPAKSK